MAGSDAEAAAAQEQEQEAGQPVTCSLCSQAIEPAEAHVAAVCGTCGPLDLHMKCAAPGWVLELAGMCTM